MAVLVFRVCLIAVVYTIAILCVSSLPCMQNSCVSVVCKNYSQSCDLLLQKATTCGCCPICINYLGENSNCEPMESNVVGVSGKHCGPQLECVDNKCRKKDSECLDKLSKYEDQSNSGLLQIGKTKPLCDDFGKFLRKQCRPGSWCYCVDYFGKRIFGETNDINPDVGCSCSRKFHDMKLLTEQISMDVQATGFNPHQHFLRCLADGDYDKLQCVGNKCFCMEKDLNLGSNTIKSREDFRQLYCYNPLIHSEYNFLRPCEEKLHNVLLYRETELKENKFVVGLDIPACDLDGSYSPKQCSGDICFCSDKDGNPIEGYKAERYTEEAEMMRCECARENLFLKAHGLSKQVDCKSTGDYESIQCLGGKCYCVDPFGDQVGAEYDRDNANFKC